MLKGRLVSLVRPTDADYELMAEWLGPTSPTAVLTADTQEYATPETLRQLNDSGRIRQFAVRDRDGRTIGTVNYRQSGPAGNYTIGGAIGDPAMWQRGLGAEAFDLLLDHLFHSLNAHRMQFTTALYNKGVLRLVIRAGFVLEGILRDYFFLDGAYHHAAVWSLLRHEYYEAVDILTRTSPSFVGPDLIPEKDKAEARDLLRTHLSRPDAETSLRLLLAEATAPAASTKEHEAR
ncbi:GNAT family N-acetyltransferase [Streptomyces sp. XM83C]|uniref:GNAT family N-acetyltransferase n=1 Tax=Streptomyces thermocoprophilus TaxID=78356 RepID=A0ABV5VIE3_9ACTN|nr:GNAT family protein [Streptomyces sp. XM83C]MCK1820281.1 GNAT family N-acetyltransferase [Streptomyces sp. XM83C]